MISAVDVPRFVLLVSGRHLEDQVHAACWIVPLIVFYMYLKKVAAAADKSYAKLSLGGIFRRAT